MWKLFHDLRSLVASHMVKARELAKIGGHGLTVEIDESLINHSTFHLRGVHEKKKTETYRRHLVKYGC